MRRILLVEDEQILRETYELILTTEPYIIETAANGEDALAKYTAGHYDLILLDIMMPIMDGVAFLEKINELDIELPKIIIMSNLSGGNEIEQAMKLGAYKSVLKASMTPRDLLATVRYEVAGTV